MVQKDYEKSQEKDKNKRYEHVMTSFSSLVDKQNHHLSNIANFIALLKQQFNWWWTGFYFVSNQQKEQDILILGPFQGPLACTKIKKGKGVCGTSWQKRQTIIVQDVNKFQGHIACSSLSKSEIVVPIFHQDQVIGVLDVDSENYSEFDEIDKKHLQSMVLSLQKIGTWKWVSQKL